MPLLVSKISQLNKTIIFACEVFDEMGAWAYLYIDFHMLTAFEYILVVYLSGKHPSL